MNTDGWWLHAFGRGIYPLGALAATQRWRRQTRGQVAFIKKILKLNRGSAVLDVGVGIGRHAHQRNVRIDIRTVTPRF